MTDTSVSKPNTVSKIVVINEQRYFVAFGFTLIENNHNSRKKWKKEKRKKRKQEKERKGEKEGGKKKKEEVQ